MLACVTSVINQWIKRTNPAKIFGMLYKVFNRFAKNSLWTLISLLMFIIFIVVSLYAYAELHLPNITTLRDVHMQVPLRIYSADHKLIGEFGTKRRMPVTLDQVPKQLIQAVLATEDSRFYEHPGVDFVGLIRAAKAVILSGQKVQGASTITMQVARNFFLTRKKTYKRKFNEILLALKIDHEFSKDKVLELYLNKIYLGQRAYGVAAAAQVYYGKTLNQLTLPEMAMIAGLPQAPSRDNPITNLSRSLNRRNHVLERMRDLNYIDEQTYEQVIKTPVTAKYHGQPIQLRADYVAEMVRGALVKQFGNEIYEKGWKVYTTIDSRLQMDAEKSLDQGLIGYAHRHGFRKTHLNYGKFATDVRTAWQKKLRKLPKTDGLQPAAVTSVQAKSINVLLQNNKMVMIPWSGLSWARPFNPKSQWPGLSPKAARDIVKVGDVVYVAQQNKRWLLSEWPQVQGAIVALNPQNGAVLALTGGFDFSISNFNRATQAKRQPGSSFKPFIYSAALNKDYTLATTINDAPIMMKDTGENQWWRPENDTDKFYGLTRLRIGLIKSRNLVSIRLLQMIGVNYAIQYAKRFGFDPNDLPHTLSLALGSASETPYQMASAYAVFANGGYRILPFFIQKIEDQKNKIIYQADPVQACEECITNPNPSNNQKPLSPAPRVITSQNAYLINSALRDVIQHGTGRAALILHRNDLAGKTGTTNKQVDAWFSGFNSNIVATVWVGFDDLESLYEYGAKAALPIWINFMRDALKGKPEKSMIQPPGLVTVQIDPRTGLLANPAQTNGVFEIFRKGNEPKEVASAPNKASPNLSNHFSSISSHQTQDQIAPNASADESLF